MQIIVNGAQEQVTDASSLAQLLLLLKFGQGRIAIEVNGEIVPRETFEQRILHEGDVVEIVRAIGGG